MVLLRCGVVVLDESGKQKPEGCAESARKDDVNGTGAHSECSGLDDAKVISVDADSAKERREAAHMDAPVVRAVCARVDGACLAFRTIEEVVREDARVDHGVRPPTRNGSRPHAQRTLADQLQYIPRFQGRR